jgi:hypothetical protein
MTTTNLPTVAIGVQIGFPEEKPIVDCVEPIDEFHVPHIP